MTVETQNKTRRRPSHPGAILSDCLPATGMSAAEFAVRVLGVPARRLSRLLSESARMTPDMAHRLARAFGTSPEVWLRHQDARDLWDAERRNGKAYRRIRRVSGARPPKDS